VTFWGVPGDAAHDLQHGSHCLQEEEFLVGLRSEPSPCELGAGSGVPFLSLPGSCTGQPLVSVVEGDSWIQAGERRAQGLPEREEYLAEARLPALDGCGLLPFGAEIQVAVDEQAASTPSGLHVDVHVPQEPELNPQGLAPAELRNITVTLPEGLAVNPSAGDGLEACTQAQAGLGGTGEAACPDASKIATATVRTPLLPNALEGFVYLASPQNFSVLSGAAMENPFGSLLAVYLVVKDPVSGVLVKLPGEMTLSETGRLTASFDNNPQLPFEDAELHFFGGARAPLVTPARCGTYTTTASFQPWTNSPEDEKTIQSSSSFQITTGPKTLTEPEGAPCPGPSLPFTPTLSSESTNVNAGGFSPLSTTLSRGDGEQQIGSVTLHYPPGLSGILKGVELCPEAAANAGSCPAGSLVGETTVSVGLGGDPFTVTGGKVYLTEHYEGAPFGLSIVNPAKAGPFVLQEGKPVVVRARVQVDPQTTALTVTTNSASQPLHIPTIIDGIPLQIKHVNVTITRPGFTFNPTSCERMSIQGAIESAEGASVAVSVPFQLANCQNLRFTPKFAVTTNGHTSKSSGASLTVTVTRPGGDGPETGQANFARVKVSLPKQLPSRLTTLQKACLARVFETNPAACPAGSIVGHARVITPLLPVPLEGPAYFVSHGGEAFPSLIMVLQGYGITVDVLSTTFISKTGITTATLKTVPDAPFTSFQLTLPQGPDSALAANTNLCRTKLTMPTQLTAQNNHTITQNTPIHATGCHPKHHKPKHTKHH
jgi:hypothetical protein